MFKVAMIQFTAHWEKEKNIEKAKKYIKEAAANGAKIICLQELFNTIYFCLGEENPKYFDLAEPIPGPTIDEMGKTAREEKIYLVAPVYEKTHVKGEFYNTAVFLGCTGEIVGKYRKSSIGVMRHKTISGNEKFYFKPGNLGFPVFKTDFGVNVGILICYDRHFPEAARIIALNGADILFIPTATCGMTKYLWEIELKAHAVENVYYVGAVNKVGKDIGGSDAYWYGGSMFVNPRGEIIAQAGDKEDEVLYAELDLNLIDEIRNTWGFFRDRRPDLYGPLTL